MLSLDDARSRTLARRVFQVVMPTIVKRYSVDPWNFEVAPQRLPGRGSLVYQLARPMRSAGAFSYPDLPDFDWRT
ncbi:MAG TPA: hypothetical protein VFZ61_16640, partial [Polyangiales bacterium]